MRMEWEGSSQDKVLCNIQWIPGTIEDSAAGSGNHFQISYSLYLPITEVSQVNRQFSTELGNLFRSDSLKIQVILLFSLR